MEYPLRGSTGVFIHVFMHFLVFGFQTAVVTIAVDNQPSPSPTPPNDTEITPPENKKPRMESPLLPHCYSLPRSETSSPQLNQVNRVTIMCPLLCHLCGSVETI